MRVVSRTLPIVGAIYVFLVMIIISFFAYAPLASNILGQVAGGSVSSSKVLTSSGSSSVSSRSSISSVRAGTGNGLRVRLNETLSGGIVFAYRGLSGRTKTADILHKQGPLASADFSLTGIPEGATVSATLYINTIGIRAPDLSALSLNGKPVKAELLSVGSDTCWVESGTGALNRVYKADVSNIVARNGIYTLYGFPSGTSVNESGGDSNGALLAAVYRKKGQRLQHVTLMEGLFARDDVMDFTQTIPLTPITEPLKDAKLYVAVADSQSDGNTVTIRGITLSSNAFGGSQDMMDLYRSGNIADLFSVGMVSVPVNIQTPNDCAAVIAEAITYVTTTNALTGSTVLSLSSASAQSEKSLSGSILHTGSGSSSRPSKDIFVPGTGVPRPRSSASSIMSEVVEGPQWKKCCNVRGFLYVGDASESFYKIRYDQCLKEGGSGTGITVTIDDYWKDQYQKDVSACIPVEKRSSSSNASSLPGVPFADPSVPAGAHFVCDHLVTSPPAQCRVFDRMSDVQSFKSGQISVFFSPAWTISSCSEACAKTRTQVLCCMPEGCIPGDASTCTVNNYLQFKNDAIGIQSCEMVKQKGGC